MLKQVREVIRRKRYSIWTEEAYVHWIRQFILFHHKRHPQEMDTPHIEAFLNHLAVPHHVAASTQNQAFSTILFLYQQALKKELSQPVNALRAKKPQQSPSTDDPSNCSMALAYA